MGNEEYECENLNNPKDKMKRNNLDMLIKEFNKESNQLAKFDNDGLFRVESTIDNKKHYYFNFSCFFDPDHGFLKCLSDLYKRYNEMKDVKEIMPFTSLIYQPLDKIFELLNIKPGDALSYSLAFIYYWVFGLVIEGISDLLASSFNPYLITASVVFYYGMNYLNLSELYKKTKEINKYQTSEEQEEQLFSQLMKFFGSEIGQHLQNCNIIEIIVDESYSLISGIFYAFTESNKKDQKVKINFWKIPNIEKAKFFKDLSQKQQGLYSKVFEKMKEYTDIKDYSKDLKKIYNKYRETYKIAKENSSNLKRLIEKEKKLKEINSEIDELKANGASSQKIQEKYEELRKYL